MKEEDAKQKWCPHMRVGSPACNTDMQTPMAPFYLCRGSDCMMWESFYKIENGKYIRNDQGQYMLSDEGDCGLKSKDLDCNGY